MTFSPAFGADTSECGAFYGKRAGLSVRGAFYRFGVGSFFFSAKALVVEPAVAEGFSFFVFGFFGSRPLFFCPFAMVVPS